MSWSLSRTGSRETVAAAAADDFDSCARQYAGQEEEKDILAAKDRTLSAIAALELTERATPGVAEKGWQVRCHAYGSRGRFSVDIHVSVARVPIE